MNDLEQMLRIRILSTLANPTRLAIIDSLRNGKLTVGEIAKETGFEQSRVSHSLKMLEQNCFIVGTKCGKCTCYTLNKETILPIIIMADEHAKRHTFSTTRKHVCKCMACRELDGSAKHVCCCKACISNVNAVAGQKKTKYRDDHTCECEACRENQYLKLANK